MTAIGKIEGKRLALQADLDAEKTADERNRMGQFATPTALASEILVHGIRLLPKGEKIRFFDPAIGTGSFYAALRATSPEDRIESAGGYEIDPHCGLPAKKFWRDSPLDIKLADFTTVTPENDGANLLICNPPL